MKKIDTINWGWFPVENLFERLKLKTIKKNFNKRLDTSLEKTDEFSLPLINAKDGNNGIMYYGRKEDFESASMCIDIVQNGAIATGNVYAQIEETGVLWDAYLIKPTFEGVTPYSLLYMARVMQNMIKEKFSYDDKAVWDKVKKQYLALPIDGKHQPDCAFMDAYMRRLSVRVKKNLDILLSTITPPHKGINIKGWKSFVVGDLFDIHPTRTYKLTNSKLLNGGSNPVVVNSAFSNGVGGYTSLENLEEGNILTFSDTVDANTIFYQEKPFVGYPHVQGMYPKGKYKDSWNKYSLQFLSTILRKCALTKGFDYGNKFRRDIAAKMRIPLPVDKTGNPDWKYMDFFMKHIQHKAECSQDVISRNIR